MKKVLISVGVLIVALLLVFSLKNYSFEVNVTVESLTYKNGATIKITSSETMKKVKIYKKAANEKFILFYVGNVNSTELTINMPNSSLSEESSTEIKVVAVNDKDETGTGSGTVDKIEPRVSINPEETEKPSWSPSPLPTKPTPSPTTSQATETDASSQPEESQNPETSQEAETSPSPSSGTEQQTIDATPGLTQQKYKTMNYFQVIPDNPTTNMPLIVFLHGDGESSNFNSLQNLPIVQYVASKEAYKAGNFVFIAPHQSEYSWKSEKTVTTLMELIEKVAEEYKVDKNRIVLTGMSRGGIGTWYIADRYPNYFSCIVPMSGASSVTASNFKNTPVWAIVGGQESYYIQNMTNIVNSINSVSGKNLAKLEKISGASHSTIQQSYKRLELFRWMLQQSKGGGTASNTTSDSGTPISATPGTTTLKYKDMNYIQVIPDNPTANMPMIIFLHGVGEIGSINGVSNLPATTFVSSKAAFQAGNFIFLAPVLNGGSWGDVSGTLMELIEKTAADYNVNKQKIILTGMSRGGAGTWYIANKHPGYFSCVVPMSATKSIEPANFKNTPVWAIVGGQESDYLSGMQRMVNNINAAGGNAKLEIVSGAVHSTIQQSYKRVELFKWMLEQ